MYGFGPDGVIKPELIWPNLGRSGMVKLIWSNLGLSSMVKPRTVIVAVNYKHSGP